MGRQAMTEKLFKEPDPVGQTDEHPVGFYPARIPRDAKFWLFLLLTDAVSHQWNDDDRRAKADHLIDQWIALAGQGTAP
jgi:hypothetical protein